MDERVPAGAVSEEPGLRTARADGDADAADGAADLSVRHVSHVFGARPRLWRRDTATDTPVLADISFVTRPGTITAIVGPSGCGKSTLLRILAGLATPSSGSAVLGHRDLIGAPGGVAYHPQRDALLPWLTARDNATLGAEIMGQPRMLVRQRAARLLERFGLGGKIDAWPDELSGGMRQRVALLRTFLMPQRLIALDEPFGALDALTRRELQLWLLEALAEDGRAALLVTHDVEEALLLGDEVLVLGGTPATIVHSEFRPDVNTRRREHLSGENRPALSRVLAALGIAAD